MSTQLAFLTGATGGIGEELSKLLEVRKIVTKKFNTQNCDLSTDSGRAFILQEIEKEAPDLVINNAGFGCYGHVTDLSMDEQRKMVFVNALALFEITKKAAETLIAQKRKGMIMNVSSVSGEFPTPGMAVYGATKAFVTEFSKAMDFECRPFGVRILVSLPGQVESHFARRAAKKEVKKRPFEMKAQFAAQEIMWQIDRKKGVHAFDLHYRFMLFLVKRFSLEKLAMRSVYQSILERI